MFYQVTKGELRKHKSRRDAWMAINGTTVLLTAAYCCTWPPAGAVYNVTQYMDYHPGGWDELVRGAGRDATDMFNEIHRCSPRLRSGDCGVQYMQSCRLFYFNIFYI